MSFSALAAAALLSVSGLLGIEPVAHDHGVWQVIEDWHEIPAEGVQGKTYMSFKAQSGSIAEECRSHPEGFLSFPPVIHGSHIISLDGHVISQFGDPTFNSTRSFYGQPVISCSDLKEGHMLEWQAFSYTKYFARISSFPQVTISRPIYNVFAETFHIIGAGAGILMAIFTFTIFAGKVSRPTTLSVCASSFFSTFYLGGCVAGFMGIPGSMLTMHKFADIGVWLSICSLVNALRFEGLISAKVAWTYWASVVVASVIILFGGTGDLVQFGTTIPFMFTLPVLTIPMLVLAKTLALKNRMRRTWLQFLSLGSFVLAVFNEMFAVTGLIHTSPMLPFGFMAGFLFLALSVNERVEETYRERDYLRQNLQNEVESKTAELTAAMGSLQNTQAELVQSAKLASLGTLSAGIAHEINNSINFVNGAIQPLEKMIKKACSPEDKPKADKLFGVMKEGLGLTLEIIKSLRNYTGLNQAKFNDIDLQTVLQSTLTILRTRIRNHIEIVSDIPSDQKVFGNVIGINQIFMNLVTNAIDAMPTGGRLEITSKEDQDGVTIRFKDSGEGISAELKDRIFEPFFTTKEVGRGTGLGLHIVRTEVARHKGTVSVESEPKHGTTFTIRLPKTGAGAEEPSVFEPLRKAA